MTYETVGLGRPVRPLIARRLRRRRGRSSGIWHLDEMFVRIAGRQTYLLRAVDSEGEVLDMLVQGRRNKHAALRLMRKLLKNPVMVPEELVADRLRAYGADADARSPASGTSGSHRATTGREAGRVSETVEA